jgi:EmrB/QacA subfamily drug resistance transporter
MTHGIRPPCDEGVIRSKPAAAPCAPAAGRWVLMATILGSSLAFIDGTVVNVALPVLQRELNASAADVQWVVEGYTLLLAALILVGGSLGDHYGRRRVFAGGVLVFTVASIWCGLAPGVGQLIAARAVQGIGGALLVPSSLAIINATFGDAERGRAIGTWSGFTAITSALGPVLGGFLVEQLSWRWVFFINVPLALVVLAIVFLRVPESRDHTASNRLDWTGAVLATVGLGALVFGLIEAGLRGLGDPLVLGSIAIGIVVFGAFLVWEARSPNPMMPLHVFRSRTFSGANLLTLLLYAGLGGALFFLPFNLIQVQNVGPTVAGAALLPFTAIMFSLSRWAGGLVDRYGAKLPLIVGPAIAAIGFALFALPGVGGSYWTTFFPAVIVLGLGMTITVAPLTTAVMGAVDAEQSGVASGINNAVSRTAGLLAIAIFGIVMQATFSGSLGDRLEQLNLAPEVRQAVIDQRDRLAGIEVPDTVDDETRSAITSAVDQAFVAGFRLIMLISAGLAALSALASLALIDGKVAARKDESQHHRVQHTKGQSLGCSQG